MDFEVFLGKILSSNVFAASSQKNALACSFISGHVSFELNCEVERFVFLVVCFARKLRKIESYIFNFASVNLRLI